MAAPSTAAAFDFDSLHQAVSQLRQKQVFFIGGAPKSGTTWLRLLLDAHPEISCGGEGHFMNRLLPSLSKSLGSYNKVIDGKNKSIFKELDGQPLFLNRYMYYLVTAAISLMLSQPRKAAAARIVGEKTPDNVRFFPALATLFPAAKFIHIVRDARDCAVSAWFHNRRVNPTLLQKKFAGFDAFVSQYAQVWVTDVKHGSRFATRFPDRHLLVRYEDLHETPIASLDRALRFLGASHDAAVLQACLEAADFVTLSGGRQPGQEDRDSFFRRGVHGGWRDYFDDESERVFRAKVEPLLSNLGYSSHVATRAPAA